ncbi:hypothetical protein L1987_63354 [Smallanthus sonchifolius]|uniref:Uncharacterized protein n=1 Tax=Smallanthus sonchifolius TaxID=185202 RepID=A0ACB9CD86_9ASTR|nr:hypothetical protein L1987_63354 [Smallanthus sonchifolius]
MTYLLYPHPFFLLLFLPFFIALPVAAESYNSTYLNCPSYKCGEFAISYPFWRMDGEPPAQFCGYEGFGINCSSYCDKIVPEITFGGDTYHVNGINYESKNIIVADSNLFSAYPGCFRMSSVINNKNLSFNFSFLQSYYYECQVPRHGINLETLPLKFSTLNVNLSFHFNCTGFPSFAIEIPCYEKKESNSYVHIMNASTEETDWDEYSCAQEVVTPVIGDDLYSLSTFWGMRYMMTRGFMLEWWRMDNCDNCEQSDGRCGHHNTTGFMCFCTDGTIRKDDCKGAHYFNRTIKLVIGIGCALVSFVIIFIVYYILKSPLSNYVASLKHKTEDAKNVEAFVRQYGSLGTERNHEDHRIVPATNAKEPEVHLAFFVAKTELSLLKID